MLVIYTIFYWPCIMQNTIYMECLFSEHVYTCHYNSPPSPPILVLYKLVLWGAHSVEVVTVHTPKKICRWVLLSFTECLVLQVTTHTLPD